MSALSSGLSRGLAGSLLIAAAGAAHGQTTNGWSIGPSVGYEFQSEGVYLGANARSRLERDTWPRVVGAKYEVGLSVGGGEIRSILPYVETEIVIHQANRGSLILLSPIGFGGVLREPPENDAVVIGASVTFEHQIGDAARVASGVRYMRASASPTGLGILFNSLSLPL